jgi:flagellar biosynthetic protein FliP
MQRAIWLVMILLSLVAPARGQVSSPFLAPAERAGPPAPAEEISLRQQQARALLTNMGIDTGAPPLMASATAAPGAGGPGAAESVPFPDASQMIPTTTEPRKLSTSLQILLLLSVLTLAPSILLMTTCFTRIIIVMSLLRQALGAAQLPPNQILVGLALFMTFLVMGPTWSRINQQAIVPYNSQAISQTEAFNRAVGVMREFMISQIMGAHNEDDVYLFYGFAHADSPPPQNWGQVDTTALVPAFVLSELKVAFLMGFRIYLPFLIIDMVISSVLISIGMQLLPPVMVSLPFKLLLFVLVDGWHLVVATLLSSFNHPGIS